ncbi:MAG: hypothetical protein ACREJA_06240, partial [Candidatus Methylomirabilales bacterium]
MARKIQGQHVEITREAVHLVPPGVGAAPTAVDQDKPLTPGGPVPARAGVGNRQSIYPKAFPMKPPRWRDWHSGMELWEVTGGK